MVPAAAISHTIQRMCAARGPSSRRFNLSGKMARTHTHTHVTSQFITWQHSEQDHCVELTTVCRRQRWRNRWRPCRTCGSIVPWPWMKVKRSCLIMQNRTNICIPPHTHTHMNNPLVHSSQCAILSFQEQRSWGDISSDTFSRQLQPQTLHLNTETQTSPINSRRTTCSAHSGTEQKLLSIKRWHYFVIFIQFLDGGVFVCVCACFAHGTERVGARFVPSHTSTLVCQCNVWAPKLRVSPMERWQPGDPHLHPG